MLRGRLSGASSLGGTLAASKGLAGSLTVGGGGGDVELLIYQMYQGAPVPTQHFTADDSGGNPIAVTPHSGGGIDWFTITAKAGSLAVFRTVEDSGYIFNVGDSVYSMAGGGSVAYPASFDSSEIKVVVADDANAENPFLGIALEIAE